MVYGYCRVSTKHQRITRQVTNITELNPEAVIIKEFYTGTTQNRPLWDRLMKQINVGDTIIFDSVSRMSRDADEGFTAYEDLYNRGVRLIFLKEPQINTDTYKSALTNAIPMTGTAVDFILDGVNRFLMELAKEQIKIAFEQSAKEVEDLHQRTREGLLTAKLNGRQVGQPKGTKLTTKKSIAAKETIKKHSKDFGGTLSDADVLKLTGLARNTYYKYKKEIREEL